MGVAAMLAGRSLTQPSFTIQFVASNYTRSQWQLPQAQATQFGQSQKVDNLRALAHTNITFVWLRTQPRCSG